MGCFKCCCSDNEHDNKAIKAKRTAPQAETPAPKSMGAEQFAVNSRFENKTAARQLPSSEDDQSVNSTERLNKNTNTGYGSADSIVKEGHQAEKATFIEVRQTQPAGKERPNDSYASFDNHQGKTDTNLPVKSSSEAPKFEDVVREQALLQGYTEEASEALLADLPTEIKFLEVVPPNHQAQLLELELKSAKQSAEQKAKNISASREMIANDPFLTMIRDIAVEQGYSKGALAVLMSDLPESMLDVKALPAKHHRLALDAEVKEAREAAETEAALNS